VRDLHHHGDQYERDVLVFAKDTDMHLPAKIMSSHSLTLENCRASISPSSQMLSHAHSSAELSPRRVLGQELKGATSTSCPSASSQIVIRLGLQIPSARNNEEGELSAKTRGMSGYDRLK